MKTLFISHTTNLDGVTLEEVMDALGVKKQLSLQDRQKVSIIEDIVNMYNEGIQLQGGKPKKHMSTKNFDDMYDLPIHSLIAIERQNRETLTYERYQAGLSGQIDPKSPIQGADF